MTPRPPSWHAPLYLAALTALPFLLPASTDPEALRARLLAGDCEALPVLAHHHPEALDHSLNRALATHSDPRLRELAIHQVWIPHIDIRTQLDAWSTLQPPALKNRAALWLDRRTTSQKTLTLADLDTYWASRDS